jgi:hypothetical protein
MKKKFIIYILFPLLILAVGTTACTEDTILADAGKLPDETTMGSIGSTLRSNSSFSGKAVIELTNDSEDEIVVDEIFYQLSRPATSDVKVTVKLETEMSMEFEAEIKADNAKIEAFNESMSAFWRHKSLLKPSVYPAKNVIKGEGILTVPAGKLISSSIKLTLSTRELPADYDVYELLFAIEQTNADGETEKQYLRYRVNTRQKAGDMTSVNGYPVSLDTRFISVFYLNTSTYQPILADIFVYERTNMETRETEAYSMGKIVNLRIATVGYDKESGRAILTLNNDLRYVLENATTYIRPLQDHERKVCLCIEGGGKGLGFCNMNDAQIADFTKQVKDAIEFYQLDGVNLWDVGSGYNKAGMPPMNTTSYPKLIKSLRDAMSDKMLTLVDKDESTASFYDPALCDGIEVGKYIDYAWHGYVSEKEEVQIIEPWETEHPYSDYVRKPIAGLTAERYGSVNVPLYPKSAGGILNSSTKKAIMWKKGENRKKNNIIVFGSDMISDEQNQYEYGMLHRYLNFINAIADDGLDWGKSPRPPFFEGTILGPYSYEIKVTKEHAQFNIGYLYLAKDW